MTHLLQKRVLLLCLRVSVLPPNYKVLGVLFYQRKPGRQSSLIGKMITWKPELYLVTVRYATKLLRSNSGWFKQLASIFFNCSRPVEPSFAIALVPSHRNQKIRHQSSSRIKRTGLGLRRRSFTISRTQHLHHSKAFFKRQAFIVSDIFKHEKKRSIPLGLKFHLYRFLTHKLVYQTYHLFLFTFLQHYNLTAKVIQWLLYTWFSRSFSPLLCHHHISPRRLHHNRDKTPQRLTQHFLVGALLVISDILTLNIFQLPDLSWQFNIVFMEILKRFSIKAELTFILKN